MGLNMNLILDRILETAKSKKYNDQDVCRIIKAGQNKIDDWKNARSKPTLEELKILAVEFEVSSDYLLSITNEPTPKSYNIDKTELELIKKYRSLDENGKGAVNAILDYQYSIIASDNKKSNSA